MNDSSNFGADFHCNLTVLSNFKKNYHNPELVLQTTADVVGIILSIKRQTLMQQIWFLLCLVVSGGLQSGFGDYSAAIKGSGTAKTLLILV
jgi:hypothetical protein